MRNTGLLAEMRYVSSENGRVGGTMPWYRSWRAGAMLALRKFPVKAKREATRSAVNFRQVGQFRGSAGSLEGWGNLINSVDDPTFRSCSPNLVSYGDTRRKSRFAPPVLRYERVAGRVALRMMRAVPGGFAS